MNIKQNQELQAKIYIGNTLDESIVEFFNVLLIIDKKLELSKKGKTVIVEKPN